MANTEKTALTATIALAWPFKVCPSPMVLEVGASKEQLYNQEMAKPGIWVREKSRGRLMGKVGG